MGVNTPRREYHEMSSSIAVTLAANIDIGSALVHKYASQRRLIVWIVNFYSSTAVRRCLISLADSPVDLIYILNNGTSVVDAEEVRRAGSADSRVTVLDSSVNLGFGGGHNYIAAMTEHLPEDIIWLLNPDTVVNTRAVQLLVDAVEEDPAKIYSPVITVDRRGHRQSWYSGGAINVHAGKVQDRQLGADLGVLSRSPKRISTEFLTGAAPLMTSSTWNLVGGFDEKLFLYWEDVAFSITARRLGVRMEVVTGAVIHHEEGASSKGNRNRRRRAYFYMARNRIVVCGYAGANPISVAFGRGFLSTLRLLTYATLREGAAGFSCGLSVLRGTFAGVHIARQSDL